MDGFTRLRPWLEPVVLDFGSAWLLPVAMQALPVGAAHAVRIGIRAIGTIVAAELPFREPAGLLRVKGIVAETSA